MKAIRKKPAIIAAVLSAVVIMAVLAALSYFNLLPKRAYTAEDFGIDTIYSPVDFNENGVDDYTDFLLGARTDAKNHPKYDGRYFDGGFPPDDIGVCTDVVWRAFKNAGYNLREMVDRDIQLRPQEYTNVGARDKNIDFRRVKNLRVFFEKHAISLTTDITDIAQWQPGDIVIFGADKHIGVVSDKRNKQGQPYIIHNGGQPNREEDYLKRGSVTGHYRFDALAAAEDILNAW